MFASSRISSSNSSLRLWASSITNAVISPRARRSRSDRSSSASSAVLDSAARGLRSNRSRQHVHELRARERRVVQVDAADVAARLRLEGRVQQRRFPGTRFADQHGDRFGGKQTVLKVAQRLPVLSRQKQVLRVRRQLERQLAKPVESLIHGGFCGLRPQPPDDQDSGRAGQHDRPRRRSARSAIVASDAPRRKS